MKIKNPNYPKSWRRLLPGCRNNTRCKKNWHSCLSYLKQKQNKTKQTNLLSLCEWSCFSVSTRISAAYYYFQLFWIIFLKFVWYYWKVFQLRAWCYWSRSSAVALSLLLLLLLAAAADVSCLFTFVSCLFTIQLRKMMPLLLLSLPPPLLHSCCPLAMHLRIRFCLEFF